MPRPLAAAAALIATSLAAAAAPEPCAIFVKLRDDTNLRAVHGRLVKSATADKALDVAPTIEVLESRARGASWSGLFEAVGEAKLAEFRAASSRQMKMQGPDLASWFRVELSPNACTADALEDLLKLPQVEAAYPAPLPVQPPLPPNYAPQQTYFGSAQIGIGANDVRALPGGTGAGVRIVDVEYQFNSNHADLAAVTRIGPPAVDPFPDNDHGTAVMGQLVSLPNTYGTTGGAYDAQVRFCPANTAQGYNPASAILIAAASLQPGDIILIEQQAVGPLGEYVPVEWQRANYDAIVAAVGSGIIVVEAAGNGGQNLDGPAFSTGNSGHWPFLPQNNSGAIIVGAGTPNSRTRLSFSTYGSRVDLQAWGSNVYTTGYGGTYFSEGPNFYYTCCFGGTSSASPIVATAAALLQANHRARFGASLSPARVREALIASGSPQPDPQNGKIGPLPNIPAAIAYIDSNSDCNSNGVPDPFDIAQGTSNDCNQNTLPDECDLASGLAHDANSNGVIDECEGVTILLPAPGATGIPTAATLQWSSAPANPNYDITLSRFADLSSPLLTFSTTSTTASITQGTLSPATTYYWKVSTRRGQTASPSTPLVASFTTLVPPPPCRTDFSHDGIVDTVDLVFFLGRFGTIVSPGAPGDTNHDGVIDTRDLVKLLGEFGRHDCP